MGLASQIRPSGASTTTLHAALGKAVEEKLIFRNPADSCKLPPAKSREMKVLAPDEIQRLLIQAREDGFYELLQLELATGLRRGEVLALQWRDLNLRTGACGWSGRSTGSRENWWYLLPRPRQETGRWILPAPVLKVYKASRKPFTSRWMFPSPVKEDSPLDPAAVRKRLQTILERAECKRLRFHDLRHTFATASLEHGMDIKTLSTIIGHVSSTTTLNTYTHITDAMRQSAADKIDRGSERRSQKITGRHPKKLAPSTFQATRDSGANRAPAVPARSMTTCGGALLPHCQRPAHGPERLRENGSRV